jgi:hypothetical protein
MMGIAPYDVLASGLILVHVNFRCGIRGLADFASGAKLSRPAAV